MTRSTRASWAIALVLFIASSAACTADTDEWETSAPTAWMTPSPTSTFAEFDGFAQEYRRTTARLAESLPADVVFPADPPGAWEADGRFEDGTGEVAAALYWRCAWTTAYVTSADSGNTVEAAAALARLAEWVELDEVRDHSDSDTRTKWIERVVEPARTGDDTTLRTLHSGCN